MDVEGIKHLNPMLVRWMYQTCCKKKRPKRDDEFWGCLRWSSQGEASWFIMAEVRVQNIPHKKWLKSATRFHLNPQLMEITCSWSMLKKNWPVHQLWTLQAAKEKCYMWKKTIKNTISYKSPFLWVLQTIPSSVSYCIVIQVVSSRDLLFQVLGRLGQKSQTRAGHRVRSIPWKIIKVSMGRWWKNQHVTNMWGFP